MSATEVEKPVLTSIDDSAPIDAAATDSLDKIDGLDKDEKLNLEAIKATVTAEILDDEKAGKLAKVVAAIPKILSEIKDKEYDEIFGFRIGTDDTPHVNVAARNAIFVKFLIANEWNVETTIEKLIATLDWRATFQPLSAAFTEKYDEELNDLGVLSFFPNGKPNLKVVTWNLYGNLKTLKKLFEKFGNSTSTLPGSQFLRWRIGLMERSLILIDFKDKDNHKTGQVHDYTNASLFRMDSGMKANTKEIVEIFSANYPELLSVKYFIGIPMIMGWVFGFVKTIGIISKETLQKFQVFSGRNMSTHIGKSNLPKEYGGDRTEKILDLEYKNVKPTEYAQLIIDKYKNAETAEPVAIDEVADSVE